MNALASGEPFHCTVAPETKPLPLTVRVKPALPATMLAGDSEVRAGDAGVMMVKVDGAALFPPVGLKTETEALPGIAIKEAATWAVS